MTYPQPSAVGISQGETVSRTFLWALDGIPVDVTGYAAHLQVRARTASPDTLLDLSTQNGGLTLGGTAGTIELRIDAETTAQLPAIACVFSLEMTSGGGDVTPLVSGPFEVRAEVTR
ncbi:hypothetical protein [Cryobacterium sp. PH31-O1]|uniref:hypothetical protein n=1 Tax=Cryobacterium sp. PH31-O1 TaxID=3046306 RepID=UPI0024BA17ED|nr:hypothetical protein [Cryobacterium sp. PH31-O1]MDJ0338271.1 hypothetical protein [Cryobacterium sp. PH31-O1]